MTKTLVDIPDDLMEDVCKMIAYERALRKIVADPAKAAEIAYEALKYTLRGKN